MLRRVDTELVVVDVGKQVWEWLWVGDCPSESEAGPSALFNVHQENATLCSLIPSLIMLSTSIPSRHTLAPFSPM